MTQAEKNKKAELFVEKLDISLEEALELVEEDIKVDHMKDSELTNDLTKEQKKAIKEAKNVGEKTVKVKAKKEKKIDEDKVALVELLKNAIAGIESTNLVVTNDERELNFEYNDRHFKVVLSAPRS